MKRPAGATSHPRSQNVFSANPRCSLSPQQRAEGCGVGHHRIAGITHEDLVALRLQKGRDIFCRTSAQL